MKKFRNFLDQVNYNCETLELLDDPEQQLNNEYWIDQLIEQQQESEHIQMAIERDYKDQYETDVIDPGDPTWQDFEGDWVYDMNESLYQVFKVTLKRGFDSEADRLGIIWIDSDDGNGEGNWVLPVYHFGTAWDYVASYE